MKGNKVVENPKRIALLAALATAVTLVSGPASTSATGAPTSAARPTTDNVGVVDGATGFWRLPSSDGSLGGFYFGNPGDVPFVGDWDCDGVDTPGLFRTSDGFVYLRDSNDSGPADRQFYFGDPGDIPLAGDFDGDGCDTVSVYRPGQGRVFIVNELGEGNRGLGEAATSYYFGNPGDKPFAGDFNGNGIDTVGLHRESTGLVYFRNEHSGGVADFEFFFGDPGDRIVAGDWGVVDGVDSPAVLRPSNASVYYRFTNTQGTAEDVKSVFQPDSIPVAGTFGVVARQPGPDDHSAPPPAQPRDRYWDWGWGVYSAHDLPLELRAMFDWSIIDLGTLAADTETLNELNQVLARNPDHKFVVELWPIQGLGDSADENRGQATLFHYLYKPGVREALHDEIRKQVRSVLEGIADPESVVGFTFLEELPDHFTTMETLLGWQRGQEMPWDVARYEQQINAELGEPFDMAKEDHRLWWGQRYAGALAEIHTTIKVASGYRDVFLWQATAFRTLDLLEPGESMVQEWVIPARSDDLVRPGLVDGIFGYPNTEAIWRQKTTNLADSLDVLLWSQLSTPGHMRAETWDETLRLVREEHPGNLGTMLYFEDSTGAGDWNPMPYEDGVTQWSVEDHARKMVEMLVDSP